MTKTTLTLLFVLLLSPSACALVSGAFRSLDDIASATNLLIVQVPTSDADAHPALGEDGVMDYRVAVLKVLKGDIATSKEKTEISTTQRLDPGGRYLLAGMEASRGGKPWFLFHWDQGVIRLPDDLDLSSLKGKDIIPQVAAMLSARRDHLGKEIDKMTQEKQRLDKMLTDRAKDKTAPEQGAPADADKPRR